MFYTDKPAYVLPCVSWHVWTVYCFLHQFFITDRCSCAASPGLLSPQNWQFKLWFNRLSYRNQDDISMHGRRNTKRLNCLFQIKLFLKKKSFHDLALIFWISCLCSKSAREFAKSFGHHLFVDHTFSSSIRLKSMNWSFIVQPFFVGLAAMINTIAAADISKGFYWL